VTRFGYYDPANPTAPNEPSSGPWPPYGLYNPAFPPATGATAGRPGQFTPVGAIPRANLANMGGIVAAPATPWAAGLFVFTGDGRRQRWTGAAWAAAPATASDDEPDEEPDEEPDGEPDEEPADPADQPEHQPA
jgi:hypothetical protein